MEIILIGGLIIHPGEVIRSIKLQDIAEMCLITVCWQPVLPVMHVPQHQAVDSFAVMRGILIIVQNCGDVKPGVEGEKLDIRAFQYCLDDNAGGFHMYVNGALFHLSLPPLCAVGRKEVTEGDIRVAPGEGYNVLFNILAGPLSFFGCNVYRFPGFFKREPIVDRVFSAVGIIFCPVRIQVK